MSSITKKNPSTFLSGFAGKSAIQDAKSHAKPSDLESSIVEVEVDPNLCRMNQFHRRGPQDVEPDEIDALSKSISALGQRTPATGYQLAAPDADGVQYILITGARRREATIKAGRKLRVRLHSSEPTTKQIVEEMWAENSDRKDYAPYYAALEMQQYIDSGAFATAKAVSTRFGIEETKVKRLLQVSAIPETVMAAYLNPAAVPMSSLLKVAQRFKDAPSSVEAEAAAIVAKGPQKDPTIRLANAGLDAKPAHKPGHLEVKAKDGRRRLHVRGVGGPELTVTISAKESVHAKVLDLLRAEFPEIGD